MYTVVDNMGRAIREGLTTSEAAGYALNERGWEHNLELMPDGAWALVVKKSDETGWMPLGYWSYCNSQFRAWMEIADQIVKERMAVQPGGRFPTIMTDEAYAEAVKEAG